MRVLVTGGSGFIGSHFIHALKKDNPGAIISVVDRAPPSEKIPGVEYEISDVLESKKLIHWLESSDFVFHFAALVSVAKSQESPDQSLRDTVKTTEHLLSLIKAQQKKGGKVPALVYSSTAAIYGDSVQSEEDYSRESFEPKSFSSNYAKHKFEAETLLRISYEEMNIKTCVFRFFNVYGEGQDPKSPYSGVVSIYLDRLSQNKSLIINGDGKQTRDFINILDIVSTLVHCTKKITTADLWTGEPINLGSGNSVSISELAEHLLDLTHSKNKIEYAPKRSGDVKYSRAEIKRAEKLLSFKPKVDLKTGLKLLLTPPEQLK